MPNSSSRAWPSATLPFPCLLTLVATAAVFVGQLASQTASTGALTGLTIDPSGARLQAVLIQLVNQETGETISTTSDQEGRFTFPALPPGTYTVEASKTDFQRLRHTDLRVSVTETLRLELDLRLATVTVSEQVSSEATMVQIDQSALGRVADRTAVTGLPLVTRNFAQLASLSPGVSTGVNNAGELGLGGTALAQIAKSNDGLYVHGARSYDNNFQLDGVSVSDVQAVLQEVAEFPFPTPTPYRNSKSRRDSTTPLMGVLAVPMSA